MDVISCARICNYLGIKTSGDTIIRLLIKRFEAQDTPECSEIIGVDDFAFKKRHTYGTIIVDEKTHTPVAVLNGRDGESLRAWLKNNKHIKTVTRDRASAYAKAISEVLPDAMQIADRFHLHQNLLEAIKKVLNKELPATIKIPHENTEDTNVTLDSSDADCKKTPVSIVDNFIILNQKRYRQIVQIQDYLAEGCSNREVARRLGISRNTVARYASGDPGVLAVTGFRQGKLDIYIADILTCLNNGKTKKETLEHLQSKGYTGSSSNTYEYFQKIEEITGVKFKLHPYVRTKTSALKNKVGSIGENGDYITRTGVFRFLWMNGNLTREHKDYIFMK